MQLGPTEIILVVFVLLLLFGGKKIPELMKGLGQGMKEFRQASREADDMAKETKDIVNNNSLNHSAN